MLFYHLVLFLLSISTFRFIITCMNFLSFYFLIPFLFSFCFFLHIQWSRSTGPIFLYLASTLRGRARARHLPADVVPSLEIFSCIPFSLSLSLFLVSGRNNKSVQIGHHATIHHLSIPFGNVSVILSANIYESTPVFYGALLLWRPSIQHQL